jgi:hypothetical protein
MHMHVCTRVYNGRGKVCDNQNITHVGIIMYL